METHTSLRIRSISIEGYDPELTMTEEEYRRINPKPKNRFCRIAERVVLLVFIVAFFTGLCHLGMEMIVSGEL